MLLCVRDAGFYNINIYVHLFNFAWVFHCNDWRYDGYLFNCNSQINFSLYLAASFLFSNLNRDKKKKGLEFWAPASVPNLL